MLCRKHRRFTTATVAALILAATTGNTAHAEPEGPGDTPSVHIGTFQTRVAPSLTKPAAPNQFASTDLLAQAIEDLEAGRRQSAQRRFEQIVYTSPQSPAAMTARQHLAKLYAPAESLPTRQSELQSDGLPKAATSPPTPADPARAAKTLASRERLAIPTIEWTAMINQPLSRAMGLAVGDRVFFSPGSVKLGARARAILRAQATWLKQRQGLHVVVAAHADESGSDSENHELSERRAFSVRARLVEEGIAADRIRIQAMGRTNPIATCAQPICSAQNRRVITSILRSSAKRSAPNTNRSHWP